LYEWNKLHNVSFYYYYFGLLYISYCHKSVIIIWNGSQTILSLTSSSNRDPAQCWDSVKKVILEKNIYWLTAYIIYRQRAWTRQIGRMPLVQYKSKLKSLYIIHVYTVFTHLLYCLWQVYIFRIDLFKQKKVCFKFYLFHVLRSVIVRQTQSWNTREKIDLPMRRQRKT
jgi:hypothetical protein